MSGLPTISIVTPSFNQAEFIQEALSSVRNQSYPAFEHLVMDGGSSDGTVDILRRSERGIGECSLRWISEPDRGQSNALNKGFQRATGDIVGWLNSDDRYRPGCFEHIANAFRLHPEMDILYGDYTWMDAGGNVFRIRREIEFSHFILLYHRVLYIPSTATFFRRRIFEEGNLLDEGLHYALDYDFFLRLAAKGYRFKHVPALLADFRFQPASKTCSMSHKQLEEQNQIMRLYSPVLRRLRSQPLRSLAFVSLRCAAAAMRYSEKMIRGYYFHRSSPEAVLA